MNKLLSFKTRCKFQRLICDLYTYSVLVILKYFKLAILGQQQGSVYIARSGGPGVPGGVPGGGQPVAINLSNNQTLNLSKAGNPGGASLSAAKITGIFS